MGNDRRVSLAAVRAAHQEAVQALEAAIAGLDDHQIVCAAARVRELGASVPERLWDVVYLVEERTRDLDALRGALRAGDDAAAGAAWSRASARWSEYLDPDLDVAGRESYRRWGHALRAAERRVR